MYMLNEEEKEGEYVPHYFGDNSPMLIALVYTKVRHTAEHMFEEYINVSNGVYHFDNTDLENFKGPVSKSYILDFYTVWKANW